MITSPGIDLSSPFVAEIACAWLSVADFDLAVRVLDEGVGLSMLSSGTLPPHAGFPGQCGFDTERPWALFGSIDERCGRVCVLAGHDRVPGAGLPRGWDSVEIVVDDVDSAADRLGALQGVVPLVAPFTADLRDLGSNMHRTAVWKMPWGTHLILTRGVTAPGGRAFPDTRRPAGRVFEVHLRTDNFGLARSLYADVLGLPSLMDVHMESGAIHDAWSLPDGQPVDMSLLKTGGHGTGNGAVELQGHPPAALQTSAVCGCPERGGTVGVTFSCHDVRALHAVVAADGRFVPTPLALVAAGPFAGHRGFIVQGVEDESIEFVESISAASERRHAE